MDTGQLVIMSAPALPAGPVGSTISQLPSEPAQSNGFTGLFAGLVAGNTGSSASLNGNPVASEGGFVGVAPAVSADMMKETILPLSMGGEAFRAVSKAGATDGSADDTVDLTDTTLMAYSGLPGAMIVQPQYVLSEMSQQGVEATEQNAPLEAVNNTTQGAAAMIALAAGKMAEDGQPVGAGTAGSFAALLADGSAQKPEQSQTVASQGSTVVTGETTEQVAVKAFTPSVASMGQADQPTVNSNQTASVGETTGQVGGQATGPVTVAVLEVKQDMPATIAPVTRDASTEDATPVQVGRSNDKRLVIESATVVSGQADPGAVPAQDEPVKDAATTPESRVIRSVANGTAATGHQQAVTNGAETVAKGVESSVKAAQVVANAAAVAGALGSGTSTSGDETGSFGRSSSQDSPQSSQMNVSAIQQQAAVGGAETFAQTTAVASQNEQPKVEQGHIVDQVKEKLSAHEIKQGSDQITLRLSPQNLGDIQVNLRLDNQQLKIEIVAQNHTVRDALLQNSDSLKESLARQNISMSSFDVSTGNNGGSRQGTSSGWEQLAQQRQSNSWMPSGYHTGGQEEVVRNMPVYLARQEHAMVDLHY